MILRRYGFLYFASQVLNRPKLWFVSVIVIGSHQSTSGWRGSLDMQETVMVLYVALIWSYLQNANDDHFERFYSLESGSMFCIACFSTLICCAVPTSIGARLEDTNRTRPSIYIQERCLAGLVLSRYMDVGTHGFWVVHRRKSFRGWSYDKK